MFDDSLNLGAVLGSMIAASFLYLPLAWYVERILPGDYGVPLPVYFPFMVFYFKIVFKKVYVKIFIELFSHRTGGDSKE